MAEENKIFNLYHRVHKELIKNIKRIAEPHEFNRGELPILATLIKQGDGVTQKEILGNLPFKKSTMSKKVNKLVQKGYLRKERDPEDRRATKIYLTEKGMKEENKIRKIDRKVEKIMLEGLNEVEKENLAIYLEKLLKNLKTERLSQE